MVRCRVEAASAGGLWEQQWHPRYTDYIVETKGLEDVNVANKDRAATLWCENTTRLTGKSWAYLKVLQTEYNNLQATQFSDLLVLAGRQLL